MIADDVLAYYESGVELARLDAPSGRLEHIRTVELLERFLDPRCSVIDVGGGTGVYAARLAGRGHAVTLVDPVPLHLDHARVRAGTRQSFAVEQGEATQLPADDDSFDAVLLLGPLYHLVDRADRLTAIRESRRVCRAGGVVVAATISRFGPLIDVVRRGLLADPAIAANVRAEVDTGRRVGPERRRGPFPDAYFHLPEELAEELAEGGLTVEGVFGVEGPASVLPDAEITRHLDDPRMVEEVLAAARSIETDLPGLSPHLLAVARC